MWSEALARAAAMDAADPLRHFRARFHLPVAEADSEPVYACGHSLGLQPTQVAEYVQAELDAWRRLGVKGHFEGDRPWAFYQGLMRDQLAALTGAAPLEVAVMNSLTINLHLLLVSFYRLFDEAGFDALHRKTLRLQSFFDELCDSLPGAPVPRISPRNPDARGAQILDRHRRRRDRGLRSADGTRRSLRLATAGRLATVLCAALQQLQRRLPVRAQSRGVPGAAVNGLDPDGYEPNAPIATNINRRREERSPL